MWILFVFFSFCFGIARSEPLSDGKDAKVFVEERISEADVMVFAKSYCPYCKQTKALLEELHHEMDMDWKYDTIDLDLLPEGDGPKIQAELLRLTGQRTVPNVFVGGTHVGGNSELQALHHQKRGLAPMLEALAGEL